MKKIYQTALFRDEIIALLQQHNAHAVIDATFGEGGHGLALAQQGFTVLGIEWDKEMYMLAQRLIRAAGVSSTKLVHANFADIERVARQKKFTPDAIIFDLGISMRHLAVGGRGFSYKNNEPLDLRISTELTTTAADILNKTPREALREKLSKYIEDPLVFQLASLILAARHNKAFSTVGDLLLTVRKLVKTVQEEEKLMRKILQGLRIIVNDEFENLRRGLIGAVAILPSGGLILVITFHSLEDRIVKLFFKKKKNIKSLGKPLRNTATPFARGAKLRRYQIR